METNPNTLLAQVFCDVIENQAFMFGDIVEDEIPEEPENDYVLASMTFSGHMNGRLEVAVPVSMSAEIAANVLGIDPDDPAVESDAEDAIKELLNVVCGNLLTQLAGEKPVFDLSVPEVSRLDEASWKEMASDKNTKAVDVDDELALLRCSLVQ